MRDCPLEWGADIFLDILLRIKICPHPRSLVKLLLCGLKTLKTDFFSDLI